MSDIETLEAAAEIMSRRATTAAAHCVVEILREVSRLRSEESKCKLCSAPIFAGGTRCSVGCPADIATKRGGS